MSSSRLPGKALLPLLGVPMLTRQVERVRQARSLDQIIIATSSDTADDAIVGECVRIGAEYSRGSLSDVLERVYRTVEPSRATVIVRLTGDCPLICPDIIDEVVAFRDSANYDYASNTIDPTYPDGLDVETMTRAALTTAWTHARLPSEREHVTPYIWKNPQLFRLGSYRGPEDHSSHRWTVDEQCDYALVSAMFERLYPSNSSFGLDEMLQLVRSEPSLERLNSGVLRNQGYLNSLDADRSRETPQ